MRVLIVDDERHATDRLRSLCSRIDGVELVGCASTGREALELIGALAPDLVLLDISMPGLDGFAVAYATRANEGRVPAIVFVTAHDRFAVDAFDVEAVDYLLKPVSLERLAKAFARCTASTPRDPSCVTTEWWVPKSGDLVRITPLMLDLIEAERDYVRLHVQSRSFLLHGTLSRIEKRLNAASFLRVHRSVIVPRERIRALRRAGNGWTIELLDGRIVPVGRTYLSGLRAVFRLQESS